MAGHGQSSVDMIHVILNLVPCCVKALYANCPPSCCSQYKVIVNIVNSFGCLSVEGNCLPCKSEEGSLPKILPYIILFYYDFINAMLSVSNIRQLTHS